VALLEDTEEAEVAVGVVDECGLYEDEGLVAKAELDVLEVLVLELGGGGGGVVVVCVLGGGVYACWVDVVGGGVYFGVVVVGSSLGAEPEPPKFHEP